MRDLVDTITSAGSVFGDWSPESPVITFRDSHVLLTHGYTATCSAAGLADFQKRMTVQELSKAGFPLWHQPLKHWRRQDV